MPEAPTPHSAATIVVAACGAISAAGCGLAAHREALRSNRSALRPSERFASPRFQTNIVGAAPEMPGDDSDPHDPAFRLARMALAEAIANARAELAGIAPERIGLVLASTKANIAALELLADHGLCSEAARRHLQGDLLAEDLAALVDARGPVRCVSLACVSGLAAIHQGAQLIERGGADAVFVVGVDHLSSFVVAGFSALKALDPAGCRPFDRARCGLSPGEAGAALLLVRGGRERGLARVAGWGCTNDANHMTGPSRDGSGLALAIQAALNNANLAPADLHYINVHGTGTPYNDAMELQALQSVFAESIPPFSGTKGLFGHTLGAAGVLETIVSILAFQENLLPGTPRLADPLDACPSALLLTPRPAVQLDHILKLNTGFGGINGALILARN